MIDFLIKHKPFQIVYLIIPEPFKQSNFRSVKKYFFWIAQLKNIFAPVFWIYVSEYLNWI